MKMTNERIKELNSIEKLWKVRSGDEYTGQGTKEIASGLTLEEAKKEALLQKKIVGSNEIVTIGRDFYEVGYSFPHKKKLSKVI